jgi:cytochrome c peroxidase
MSTSHSRRATLFALIVIAARSVAGAQGLPPVPVPSENPITEEKRALGKILFWDEQLSGDDTVACGTCHSNGRSGTDGRIGIYPGPTACSEPRTTSGVPGQARRRQRQSDPRRAFGLDVQ